MRLGRRRDIGQLGASARNPGAPGGQEPVSGRGPSLILHGMEADDPMEPDVARLFAPVAVEETFAGVLIEARQVLGQLDDPVDAELWGIRPDRRAGLVGCGPGLAAGHPHRARWCPPPRRRPPRKPSPCCASSPRSARPPCARPPARPPPGSARTM